MVTRALLLFGVSLLAIDAPAADVRCSWYPGGRIQTVAHRQDDVLHGEYRSWYPNGALFEVRHYAHGRESGLQQAWTADGQLYLNYEVRDGRRYGYVNARPCVPVAESAR